MIIIFDTETTGLPKKYDASAEDVENWPRVIQLAYAVFQKDGTLVKRVNNLIKPNGWQLMTVEEAYADALQIGKTPEEAAKGSTFWVDKGYTNEKLMEHGIAIELAMNEFINDRLACEFAVAHNIAFDGKILRAEMIRMGLTIEFTAKKICTMMKTTKFCNIQKDNGKGAKWLTLTELHKTLFGMEFEGSHDAGNDVDACAKCFFELVKLGVLELN